MTPYKIRGTVKFYSSQRGFGFLAREDGGPDVFVGAASIVPMNTKLDAGAVVTFGLEDDRQGRPHAVRVHLAAGIDA